MAHCGSRGVEIPRAKASPASPASPEDKEKLKALRRESIQSGLTIREAKGIDSRNLGVQ